MRAKLPLNALDCASALTSVDRVDHASALPRPCRRAASLRIACVALPLAFAAFAYPRLAHAQCVDEELKEELVGGRHYRGVEDRLFTKAYRFELSAMGGYYAADLYSSFPVVG